MARIRIFVVLVIALTAGGVFAYATYRYVQQPPPPASMKTRPVVVAATNLPLGKELKPEDVRIIEWPQDAVPVASFTSADDVMGRGVISPMVQNEPILEGKLAAKGAGAGLPLGADGRTAHTTSPATTSRAGAAAQSQRRFIGPSPPTADPGGRPGRS